MMSQTANNMALASDRAVLLLDPAGVISFSNAAAARLFGANGDELTGRPVASLLTALPLDAHEPEDRPEFCQASRSFSFQACGEDRPERRGFEGCWRQLQGMGLDGHPFPLEAAPEKLELDGKPVFLLHLRGMAERCEDRDHLRGLQSAVEQSTDSVLITDREGIIEFVNPAFEAMTGYHSEEAIGRTPALLGSGSHSTEFYANLWAKLTAGEEFCGVFVNRRKNGDLYHEEERIRPVIDAGGHITHFVATGRDVGERIRAPERLERLANYDMLTGLPNRGLFKDRLQREFVHASRYGGGFALLYLDLDRFKPVNDRYGHTVGNLLLQDVAALLRRCVREEDTVARLGGDEFAVILKEVSRREYARKILKTIIACLRCGAVIDGHWLPLSASIGACIFPEDGADEHTLLKRADSAMYRAKAAGGNGYCFFDADREAQRSVNTAPSVGSDVDQRNILPSTHSRSPSQTRNSSQRPLSVQ